MSSPAVVNSVLAAIGHTPVVRLRRVVPATSGDVFVKLEYFNPTGSEGIFAGTSPASPTCRDRLLRRASRSYLAGFCLRDATESMICRKRWSCWILARRGLLRNQAVRSSPFRTARSSHSMALDVSPRTA